MGACVIDGVSWDVLGDFGAAPFILDRDLLGANPGSELTPSATAATESIGDMLLSATWAWGPSRSLGPLTEPAAGRAVLSFLDTLRTFDPINVDSPLYGYLKLDLPIVVTADALPAFTGKLRAWEHDLGPSESTLELADLIAELGMADLAIDDAALVELGLPTSAADTATMQDAILAAGGFGSLADLTFGSYPAGWGVSANSAYVVEGYTWDPGTKVLAALADMRRIELGRLVAMRNGAIGILGSLTPYAPASSLTVNCGGVFLADLAITLDRGRVRNQVRIKDHLPSLYTDADSVSRNGVHEVTTSVADLLLAAEGSQPVAGEPYDRWAAVVLDELAEPPAVLTLGTLRPTGPTEVGKVARCEPFDRWTVVHDHVVPPIAQVVSVIGMRASLTTTGLEANVVTENVA